MRPRPPLAPAAAAAIAIAAFVAASSARADSSIGADLRTFRPSTDKSGTLATESVDTPGPGNLQVAMWSSFSTTLLKVREPDRREVRVVGPQLLLDPTIALGLGPRAAIGLTTPVVVAQQSNASSLTDGNTVPMHGIGDLTLTGKATVFQPAKDSLGGYGLAFVARFSLPTGDRTSFSSDDGLISELRGLLSYDYVHTLSIALTAGYRMRQHHHDLLDATLGDSIPWGLTLGLRPRALGLDEKGHWSWMLEGHGEIGVSGKLLKDSRTSPVLLGPSLRYAFGDSYSFFAGAETSLTEALGAPRFRVVLGFAFAPTVIDEDHDGVPDSRDECPGLAGPPPTGCPIYDDQGPPQGSTGELGPPPDADSDTVPDAIDKCPNEPETFDGIDDTDGCPEAASKLPPDRDRDGILDDVDKCPDNPETLNGYEDEDGCPEVDTDNDTFLDDVDHCPNEPETFNAFEDDDGCPDKPPAGKGAVLLSDAAKNAEGEPTVAFTRKISFEGDAPSKDAMSDLRALAAWLLAHPGKRVQIAVQPEAKNEAASMARADAIAQAIVRYAHTGGAAASAAWNAKKAPKSSNVQITVGKEFGLEEGSTEVPSSTPPTPKDPKAKP